MWSDGSPQTASNLGFDSGLDGSHCCVKVEVFDQESNGSVWWGEDCENILYGICEFHVQEYLDTPANLTSIAPPGSNPTSLTVSWSGENWFWSPNVYTVDYCHVESLSKAALPVTEEEKCGTLNSTREKTVMIHGLKPFSEYEITVKGRMEDFMRKTQAKFKARTCKLFTK